MPKLTTPIDEEFQALPERIALALKEVGMAQRQAATQAGISPSTISRIDEARLGAISANQLVRLAKALRVRVGWLLVGEEPMRAQQGTVATMPVVFVEKTSNVRSEAARAKRNSK